jgi:DNA-binding NarL/FixJ family response regulator
MRVVIADDSVLLREGLARLLAEAGIHTCAMAGDADSLEAAVAEHRPDVALVDIRMPPTYTHEGAQAAVRLRERSASLGILLLSQSLESRYAATLAQAHPKGFGYLLALMAQGRSNMAISRHLVLGPKTIESHIASILTKLGLLPEPDDNRRVLAVLTWLQT